MKKRSKFYFYSVLVVLFSGIMAGYFYLPGILADSVYPLKYPELIRKYAQEHNVDAALVAALIRQESNYNPNALSGVGARGLTQIMVPTAKTIAIGEEDTNFYPDKLYDPETNIRYGTWYLRTLLDRYNNNTSAALTAYNLGTGNVDRSYSPASLFKGNSYAQKIIAYQSIYAQFYSRELYGVDAKIRIEKPKQTVVWSMMLKDLVGVFYGGK